MFKARAIRRAAVVALPFVLVLSLAQPARAGTIYGQQCKTFTSNDNTRAVQLCAQLWKTTPVDGTAWAGRIQAFTVAGKSAPYAVQNIGVRFWSTAPQCDGNLNNNCNGWGDIGGPGPFPNLIDEVPGAPFHDASAGLLGGEHHCTGWAEIYGFVRYRQGGTGDTFDFNSQALTVPPCT